MRTGRGAIGIIGIDSDKPGPLLTPDERRLIDALIDQIKTELDVEKRRHLINEALMIQHDELLHLPLHRQVIPWATRSNVRAVHLANNNVIPQWVTVK